MLNKKIRFLVMDVDGTLTDGKIYMGPQGEAMKAFDIKDGCGIAVLLPAAGIVPIIITGRSSKILENRCREIGITQLHQGIKDKTDLLFRILDGESLSAVAYIGDDINDLACMRCVKEAGGIVGCPADAVAEVKKIADFITEHTGGNGAVREFIEWIVQ